MHDGNPRTAAVAETSPASLFLLLDAEAILAGAELRYTGRLVRASLQVSDDGLNWTSPSQEARADARAGRHEIVVAPVSARSVMLRIEFQGRNFRLREATLKSADLERVAAYDIELATVTENSAELRWRTTLPVRTNILYGFAPDRMTTPGVPPIEPATEHRVRLTSLLPGTEYRAWILLGMTGEVGEAKSPFLTFRTRGTPYPFAGAISFESGRDTALIRFTTPIPAKSRIEWTGGDGTRGLATEERFAMTHAVALAGLRPRTVYSFEIVTEDTKGRRTATPLLSLTTRDNNVAIGARAIGTFDRLIDEQAVEETRPALERITDGRNDYFAGMATSGDPADTDQWVEVDLGREVVLSSIETVWRGNAYPRDFFIMTSRDRVNWAYPGFGLDAGAGTEELSTRGDPLRRVVVAPASDEPVRYIKVLMMRGSAYFTSWPGWRFVNLAEIEAHEVWSKSNDE